MKSINAFAATVVTSAGLAAAVLTGAGTASAAPAPGSHDTVTAAGQAIPNRDPGHYAVIKNHTDHSHWIYITRTDAAEAKGATAAEGTVGVRHIYPRPRIAKPH